MTVELDYLMTLEESGVVEYEGSAAAANDISEWFATPRGQVYGRPDWGNELVKFRHEPPTEATAIAIENSVVVGIARDMPYVQLAAIRCEPHATVPDMYLIQIATPDGVIETPLSL